MIKRQTNEWNHDHPLTDCQKFDIVRLTTTDEKICLIGEGCGRSTKTCLDREGRVTIGEDKPESDQTPPNTNVT